MTQRFVLPSSTYLPFACGLTYLVCSQAAIVRYMALPGVRIKVVT